MRKILAFQQKVTDKYCILGKRLKDQRKCHFLMPAEFCQDKIYWKRRGGENSEYLYYRRIRKQKMLCCIN